MQVRIREFVEATNEYKLITYFNCEDYSELIKMLNVMSMNDENLIEISHDDMVGDVNTSSYSIKSIQFVLPEPQGDLLPYIAVDVEEIW